MGGAVLDGFLCVVELEESEHEAACETVAAADPIEDLEIGIRAAVMEG